ncbi:MAG: FAD-dependent oxidoreductase [Candidatus Bathyarchaeota archaeon]|nr:FAD-dependent oxidoreductase [Candidatus Bathyarchaeota archaeon]
MMFETYVKAILPRTRDVTSFRFTKPVELRYSPGQYMFVTISAGEKQLTHPFSFSSSPTEKDFVEFTKKFTSSEYSVALKALKLGDSVKIDAPYGSFTFMGEHKKILLLAGGIGITPFRSICRYSTDLQLPSEIVLLYGCRTENDVSFGAELELMQQQNPKLKVIFVLNEASNSWHGKVGLITADLIKEEVPDYKERTFFACGPPAMVVAMSKIVAELGLPKKQLKLESFTGHI